MNAIGAPIVITGQYQDVPAPAAYPLNLLE
jgi:hypothetical protein